MRQCRRVASEIARRRGAKTGVSSTAAARQRHSSKVALLTSSRCARRRAAPTSEAVANECQHEQQATRVCAQPLAPQLRLLRSRAPANSQSTAHCASRARWRVGASCECPLETDWIERPMMTCRRGGLSSTVCFRRYGIQVLLRCTGVRPCWRRETESQGACTTPWRTGFAPLLCMAPRMPHQRRLLAVFPSRVRHIGAATHRTSLRHGCSHSVPWWWACPAPGAPGVGMVGVSWESVCCDLCTSRGCTGSALAR